jgi:hypothetical protein
MPESKVFISYSHVNKKYREEVRRVLEVVPSIKQAVWFDEKHIGISDKFDPAIRQAMEDSCIGILLLSTDFFGSEYITQHELPYLLRRADQGTLKLACIYVTMIPKGAFQHPIDVDGQPRTVSIKEYIGANSSDKSLEALRKSQRQKVYVELANWVEQALAKNAVPAPPPPTQPVASNTPRRPGERRELALALQHRSGHWQVGFSLPRSPHFKRLAHVEPAPASLFHDPAGVDGERLFYLLFGSDRATSGAIIGAAFDLPTADPTRYPLRLRLCTDDERLYSLPWNALSYQGRRLVDNGWTVELHPHHPDGFPEFPPHACYFPGKVVLIQASEGQPPPQAVAHGRDLHHFFQRHWQDAPAALLVHTVDELRETLRAGATRLVYVYGTASVAGLFLDGTVLPWSTLAEQLQRSQSVSAVFVNLLGDASLEAIPANRVLLDGARAVLVQWHAHTAAADAARAGLAWLNSVFVANERLDPVVALHQHGRGRVLAWTRYASWQTVAPYRLTMPELVNLLLDRRSQRAELAQAKNDFYTYQARRIYQAVAFGLQGALVHDFPGMVRQHLLHEKRPQEVFRICAVSLRGRLSNPEDIDDLVRQQYHLTPRQPVLPALLGDDTMSGNDFWFMILGWKVLPLREDAQRGKQIVRTIAIWCRTCLLQELRQNTPYANVRVLSVVTLEASSDEVSVEMKKQMTTLIKELNNEAGFHFGELAPLGRVNWQDLWNYFHDHQICSCPDPFRSEFPDLILAGRSDMAFGEAVATIKRGEPDNWGNLMEELQDMTARREWPPEEEDKNFWGARDGR